MEIGSTNGTTKIVKLAMANDWLPELHVRGLSPGSGMVQVKSQVAAFEMLFWSPYGTKWTPPLGSL